MARSEHGRVLYHLLKARLSGTEASLTLTEWEQTIVDFCGRCAYCRERPFTDLEHFLPVAQSGTHVGNCIPSCRSCNVRKHNLTGDRLIAIFGKDTITSIQQYLARREKIAKALGVRPLDLLTDEEDSQKKDVA